MINLSPKLCIKDKLLGPYLFVLVMNELIRTIQMKTLGICFL